MPYLSRFTATLAVAILSMSERLRSVAKGDRGDSPVSTAILVALLAAAAVVVAVAIKAAVDAWILKIPQTTTP